MRGITDEKTVTNSIAINVETFVYRRRGRVNLCPIGKCPVNRTYLFDVTVYYDHHSKRHE